MPLVGEDQTADRSETEQERARRRVTVAEAAEILGITAEAVRTRIKRGKLDSVKEPRQPGGTVYVLLETDQTGPNADPTSHGQVRTGDQTPLDALIEAKDETIAELRSRVEFLERQLNARQEELRRRDILLAQMVERVPMLEAPTETVEEASEAPREQATEQPGRVGPQAPLKGAQEGSERPWWRRIFGE